MSSDVSAVDQGVGALKVDDGAHPTSGALLDEIANTYDTAIKELSTKKNKIPSDAPTIDISHLSAQELMRIVREKEVDKQRERYIRSQQKGQEVEKEFKFWNTQPVPKLKEKFEESGPIDENIDISKVKQEPFNMPAGFEWCEIDINDPVQQQELYSLLSENYVEDDDCLFRFDYSIPFLHWALTPPGYLKDWHLGVRNTKTGSLMGSITAVPAKVRVHSTEVQMVEINFLCVHKKLRSKRLAPVLIKEITRRVNLRGIWQATYTAGVVLPKPVGKCRYYHRSLNPKKLIEVKFSTLPARTTLANHIRGLKIPDRPLHNLRRMEPQDAPSVYKLLNATLERRKLVQLFTEEDVSHVLLPKEGVVDTYVLPGDDGKITDFCSFYHLPSSVFTTPKHKKLNAVYSYYNAATTMPFAHLMLDALILAKAAGADVFNALNHSENGTTFEELQFGQGDGFLQYYVYNWKCPTLEAEDVGLVLL